MASRTQFLRRLSYVSLGFGAATFGCALAAVCFFRAYWLQPLVVALSVCALAAGVLTLLIDCFTDQAGLNDCRARSAVGLGIGSFVILYLGGITHDYVGLAAARSQSKDNLQKIATAFHHHQNRHGFLPSAALNSEFGQPLLSWRVALLPDLGQEALYREFKLDEPWDSAHNITLIDRMPAVFQSPQWAMPRRSSSLTYYQVFVDPGTAFEPGTKLRIGQDFPDGTSNTILAVEAGQPVPWTKPEDLPYRDDQPLPALGGIFTGATFFPMSSGTNRKIMLLATVSAEGRGFALDKFNEETLRNAIVRNDGKILGTDWWGQ